MTLPSAMSVEALTLSDNESGTMTHSDLTFVKRKQSKRMRDVRFIFM